MASLTTEDLDLLLKRVGMKLPQKELEQLRPIVEQYLERLKVLHAADLGTEEVAAIFRAEWNLG